MNKRLFLPALCVAAAAAACATPGPAPEPDIIAEAPMAEDAPAWAPLPEEPYVPDEPYMSGPGASADMPLPEAMPAPGAGAPAGPVLDEAPSERARRPAATARRSAPPGSARRRAPAAALPAIPREDEPRIVSVPFATTRAPTEDGRGGTLSFSDGDAEDLIYGVSRVSVPPPSANECGRLESPFLGFRPDRRRHVVFDVAAIMPEEDFFARLRSMNAEAGRTLVYIHGHSVSFENANRRAASLHQDLVECFDAPVSVPVVFSWPAKSGVLDSLLSYNANRNRSRRSEKELREFLLALHRKSGARQIDVIAHSMGASMLVDVLQEIQLSRPPGSAPLFGQVIFAAPDVDRDTFADRASDFAAKGPGQPGVARRMTLYASDSDKALLAAARVWESDRAGQASPLPPLLVPGVDTIDASAVTTDLFGLNHTAFAEVESIVADIAALLRVGAGPAARGLAQGIVASPLPYWAVAPEGR